MKKFLKSIGIALGIIIGLIAALTLVCIGFALIDDYVNSKVDKVQTAVQTPATEITITTNNGYCASTSNIELTATPDEFNNYFEKVLASDTINQIIITGHRLDNDTKKMKWDIVYEKLQSHK